MKSSKGEGGLKELRRLLGGALQDRYTLDRIIGSGGMAVVFSARDIARERPVAIKVMRPEVADSVATARFLREILWSSRVQHPHIVPLLDSGEAAGFPYAVMPLIEGETLASRLARTPAMPLAEAVRYAGQVASALAYAHQKGIVHRDIKPENILLSHGYALVADFGIARALGLASEVPLTAPGMPIGTLAYMSPEQAMGRPDVDGRADIYSLACVVYEMLAGRPAHDSASIQRLLMQRGAASPPPLGTVRPDVPARVADAVDRSLSADPAERIQSAEAFAEAMGHGSVALPEPETRPTSSRTGLWLLIAAVVAVILLVLTYLGTA
ncbi:MAG TPA: serine/threonine-protein kinase [Gemmatimonadales bacterium]